MAKRQGFFNKLIMGADNAPDFTPVQLPSSRWGLFWDVFKNRLFELFKVSLWGDLFALPLLAVLLITYLNQASYNIYIPYDGNLGVGYPVELNAVYLGDWLQYWSELNKYLFLLPCILVLAVGLTGVLYVMRRLIWGEDVSVTRHFFKGIKENWKEGIGTGIIFGLSLLMMMFNFIRNDANVSQSFWDILLTVLGVIQFVLVCSWTIFMMTQTVTYVMKFRQLAFNSFLFGLAFVLNSAFFAFLAMLPLIIPSVLSMFVPMAMFTVSPVFYIAYVLIGISFSCLIFTVYAHYVFDKYVTDKISGAKKNRGMYVKTPEEEKAEEIKRIKSRNIIYGEAYVAKRLSSIDAGSDITPLGASYSRADLQRLSEEKEKIREEVEHERIVATEELHKEIAEFEANEAQKQEKGKKRKK